MSLSGEIPAGVEVTTTDVLSADPTRIAALELMLAQMQEKEPEPQPEVQGKRTLRTAKAVPASNDKNRVVLAAYDISLGEYQPDEEHPLRVSITDDALTYADGLQVWHLPDEGGIEEIKDFTRDGNTVSFDVTGLSIYAVTGYTVDFHWGEYTYSIAGESEIALSALLENLSVTEITVADVTAVSFSNADYIEIEQTDSDWLLRSIAPFHTDETLTLTLANGQSVEIKVTDVDYNVYNNSDAVIGSWTLDSEGVLTVTGTGAMKDYTNSPWVAGTPWFDFIVKDSTHSDPPVTKIVIAGDITRIGTNSFTRTYNLNEIDASNCTSLTAIGESAFKQQKSNSASNNPDNPKIINFSGCVNLSTIQGQAFQDCNGIEELDISGTKLKPSHITTAGAGFGSAKSSLEVLRANGCTTDFTTLNLDGWNSLQTVELSGCTNLTVLNIPSNVTTLNLSGCTGLAGLTVPSGVTTLNVSGCTGLTWIDASGCTGLTTLNVSGCTGLTSLTVPSTVTSLNVSGCTGMTTLDASGCTGLTSLTVPSGVTTLDVSNAGLTSLDLSACTSMTTLDVSGCTGLTSLTVPSSVTTLDVSGCTGLTNLTVPSGVTTLNVSNAGLTSLDLSACTAPTTLYAANCTALTALKLPATVTDMNIEGCSSDLVIYFDGTSDEFESIKETLRLENMKVLCWGDYTYSIKRDSTVALSEILTDCRITTITSEAVEKMEVSGENPPLKVEELSLSYQHYFTEPQALTLTLKNGMTGSIRVVLSSLEESRNLNSFLDDSDDSTTIFKYNTGEESGHPLSEAAVLKEGDLLYLTLSFSEIPEGQEGERQMKLPESMTYTLPEGLTAVEGSLPESVTISVPSGEDTNTYSAAVTLGTNAETGAQTITVTGDFTDGEEIVRAATTVSFTIPVTVQVSTVPYDYELGNSLTLRAVKRCNVKASGFTEKYNSETGNITYTVTVEAQGDLDPYIVTIADLTTGDSPMLEFVSGSYTYAHKEGFTLPVGKPATQIDGVDVTPGSATGFTQFPLTVAHMYDGDTITLTYSAKVLKGVYNKDRQQTEAQNTVTVNCGNPSNDPEDDTASVFTPVPYEPLTREYVTLDGSWAYWRVTVNPDGYTLNGGSPLTLADTFHDEYERDAGQSIDYASVTVSNDNVTYDYSGYTGTFRIPDSTPVVITYRTRITAQPGEAKTFRGTARLKDKDTDGNTIATSTAGVTGDPVVIYPSPSDVAGFGDNFMVELYVYAENAMQTGIGGATFILLDANQRALEYKLGDNKGDPVTFTTNSDGYVNIELHEEAGDVSIEKNTGYYLEMMQAVEGYQKDNTLYSFMITDDPAYSTGGFYQYYNGDTMKVRLYEATPNLRVSIRFSGSYPLREDQQNAVMAVLQKWVDNGDGIDDDNDWEDVERHPYTDTQWGAITFKEELYDPDLGNYQNIYRVVEKNQNPWDLPDYIHSVTTYYSMVNTAGSEPKTEPQEFIAASANDSVSVVIDNLYEEPQLTLVKMDKKTGETLSGAVFSVYKIESGAAVGDPVTSYTTGDDGEVVIRGGESFTSETLYGIKETQAPVLPNPDDPEKPVRYLLPLNEEWRYFYFCNDEVLEPSILENLPEGATAVNLTNGGDRISVDNQKEYITVPVMKLWQGEQWPGNAEVVIGLYQSVEGGKAEPVYHENSTEQRTVTLTGDIPYNNTAFAGLPSRDDQGRNITYSIKEESINDQAPLVAGYNQEYGVSSAGVYIVRNKPATTLTVSKKWFDLGGNEVTASGELAKQSSVTFDVYRTINALENPPENGVSHKEMETFVSNLTKVRENLSFVADEGGTMSISDLDIQDDLGNPYHYYILETVPSFGNELYEVNEQARTVTIKNKVAPETVKLTVTKAELVNDPRPNSVNKEFKFTLKLDVVNEDDTHPVRSWQVYSDGQNNLVTGWNGEATFTLKPEESITLSLPVGVKATVTEEYHHEYTVDTSATVAGDKADDNRTFTYDTSSETPSAILTYTNTLHVICKVVTDGGDQVPFESLSSALARLHNPQTGESFNNPWTIYMLEDYTIPASDGIDLAEGESLILTTAPTDDDELFPFNPPEDDPDRSFAVITRGEAGGSMLTNAGTLTLENICLDGGNIAVTADGGLVNSTGTLNLNAGTTLRNSRTSGKGGAVCVTGTVNIVDDVALTGNSAPSASALYLKGTLSMTGGSITGNSGASDGAVVAESMSDVINLSGGPVIFNNNTNAQGKAANLFIGADSDNIVNVVAPGLSAGAHIGITAMEGHMAIGEQFASAEFGQTENLGRFVNDVYGYKGKLKDGTSTNVVWDGLTIIIEKAVDPVGANPNDRFTINLSSTAITMSTYVIDGTVDYTITAARLNRPGRITLRNVKAGDVITITPLPVGSYTVAEESSNYTPSYTIVETGSAEEATEIVGGRFTADNNSTVTVTNTRRLATVKLTKGLDDRLATGAVNFNFAVKLTDADGTAVSDFALAEGITTGTDGVASFTMSPTNALDVIKDFKAPVGATMTITEVVNENYRITTRTEGAAIEDLDEDNDNVFAFVVTDNGADVTFENTRKLAEIALSKTLVGKVSEEEPFTFTLTLTNGKNPVANYLVYEDKQHPEKNITTNADGVATIIFTFGENETETKSIPLTIPESTKLVVTETVVKKDVGGTQKEIYTTNYSINGAAAKTGATATITKVSDSDKSIAFTNTRKTNTITVKNTVNGYSGNVVPFTYTATVTDGGENDYDLNGFENGVMTFELAKGQSQKLTVPYGATLNVAEGFIVGYETTAKIGSTAVTPDTNTPGQITIGKQVSGNETWEFTNNQLIGLRLVNNTSSALKNVKITVGKDKIYLVNSDQSGQELIGSNKTATLERIAAGETAILEIEHEISVIASQSYSVKGATPAVGYYYTIHNEPSFHETANPAILRVYDSANYEVKGELRYSVEDSTVTFTEQPLVSFDSNGGSWTTEMDGYHDRDGDRKVYQKPVNSGKAVTRPTPDPVYPTAEGIPFLGWTTDETFAKKAHTESEDISAKLYVFENTLVTTPFTLYAIWARDPNVRTVTVKNGLDTTLTVTVTLTNNDLSGANYTLYEDTVDSSNNITTDASGAATFTLAANETRNLHVPDGAKLVISSPDGIAYSSDYTDTDSVPGSFTINSVQNDGTVSFIGGIFKITDAAGNLLYDANGRPAVYGNLRKTNNADPDEAFDAYEKTLYTDASHTTEATPDAVKQLVDEYTIPNTAAIAFPNMTMTLTTAGKDDRDFPYVGVRDRAAIYRSTVGAGNNCFTLASGNITLTNIILDGGSENGVKIAKTANGGLIYMSNASGVLNIETGTTMRNCEFAAYDNANNSRGGAIYMTNGTLNVNAGLFSNLHAYQGGAICVTGGTLNVTGTAGSTQFEDCRSERQDGGAIYHSAAKDVVIDGGTDKDNPGIIFTRCVAAYTNGENDAGDGGAIFATSNYTNTVTVKGCSFIECSARTGNKTSTGGFGGGGICALKVKGLTVEACTFESCDTLCGGGAVAAMVKYTETVDNETVTIKNCSFNQCNCKGQAGALGVYQDENGKTNSATKLSIIGSTFENCSSGTNNGSGGAVQCYLPCMVFTDSSFTDCWAGKEGGAVNNFFGGSYTDVWAKSFMTVDNCHFIRCRAEDRYDTSALQHYGGGINTKVKTVAVTNSYFEDCVSTLKEGGALHIGGQGGGSMATITGSTFKNCTAKNGGGAILSSHETLTIDNSKFYGCGSSASNGGAVYHYRNSRGDSQQNDLTITGCTFGKDPDDTESLGCSAALNGGAIWTRAGSVTIDGCTIDGCTASKGGGIYLSKEKIASQSGIITDCSITGCQAANGSAVYAENEATFSGTASETSTGLSITGNTVTDVDSGAIQGAKLNFGGCQKNVKSIVVQRDENGNYVSMRVVTNAKTFGGNTVVENNIYSGDRSPHDVALTTDSNAVIYTTEGGLSAGAKIGVYVKGVDGDNFYGKHGQYQQPFGTYHNSEAGSNFLDAFFNDRNDILYGYQGTEDLFIHWGYYVCKITDADGNTLKRTNGRDAVYQQLSQAFEEFTSVKNDGGETDKAVYIKMLVEDYPLRQTSAIATNFPAADITLTTETHTGTEPVSGEYDGNHPYRGTPGSFSTIYRTNSNNPLFNVSTKNAVFQLKDITLDGRQRKTTEDGQPKTEGDYKLITASTGEIIVNSGTTLQYAKGDSGAAITGATVTIKGSYDADKKAPSVKITNCTATGNGGAISAQNLTITNTSTGEYGTAFTNCTAAQGGAIYASGTAVKMAGATFTNCIATGEGGVLYHNNDSTEAATEITNCAFAKSEATGGAGGAVSSKAGELTVNGSSFDTVKAAGNGGAINHTGTISATISDTTFKACSATGFGGSVYTAAKTVSAEKDSFRNSTAANDGGALYCASSDGNSAVTVSGTSFDNCSVTDSEGKGKGGAIYSKTNALSLQNSDTTATTINACTAPGFSGAVYMETTGSALNITGSTVISACYAKQGGAIYLPAGVTMNISDSPEFSQNGYTTQNGSVVNATAGACIYLAENGRINFQGSPKFSRNILPNLDRITNGGIYDNVRQDIYLAGYESVSAASIYVVGKLTGDTIWVWPEKAPHRLPNEQFAKIAIPEGTALTADELDETLSHFRNSLADAVTGCNYGEYLAGVKVGNDNENVYWDKMYSVSFKKKDNKGVSVPDAGFTLYHYKDLSTVDLEEYFKPENGVVTFFSADGENDTDAQGKLLDRGMVEFAGIRIGAYYMKETTVPTSFKENDTIYLVLVGTPYLSNSGVSSSLWEENGPLNVNDAGTLVARYTTDAGKYYGIFPLDENNKAILRANIASNNVGIENIRNDYQASFMKLDEAGNPLPGAAFTIYSAILNSEGQPETLDDGYPKLSRWSRDGETYPAEVVSAPDPNDPNVDHKNYRDVKGDNLPKGLVYFRELPLGTYYLLETAYPERNGSNRTTFYKESDRVFKLEIKENVSDPTEITITLSEWKPADETNPVRYELLSKNTDGYYTVSNQEVVCKLTDADDKLLYTLGHEVWEKNESSARPLPAIYHTLEEGFAAAQKGSFVDANGNAVNPSALKLQVLKDCTLTEPITYSNADRPLTFTTAPVTDDPKKDPLKYSKDRYIFSTSRTDADRTRALICRGYDGNSGALITITGAADMTVRNILLSGVDSLTKPHEKIQYYGRALRVVDGQLTIVAEQIKREKTRFENFIVNGDGSNDAKGGAVLMDSGTTLNVDGGYNRSAEFTGNTVQNTGSGGAEGGALAVSENCTVNITNAQFNRNGANAGDNKGFGGAIHVSQNASVTIDDSSITGNMAAMGSAIFADNSASVTITGDSITGCSITDNRAGGTNGGAINVGGPNARLYFGGLITVLDNLGALGNSQQMNLVLSENSNEVINTTEGGLTDGVIGVYAIESTPFENHGLPGKPFGTFGDKDKRANPQVFRSDHSLALYGVRNEDNSNDDLIYWVDVICKLTDDSDKILYQDISLNISGNKETRKAQAVYARITQPENPDLVKNGFNALRDGFEAAQGTLYSQNGTTYTALTNETVKLKMLKDVALDKGIVHTGSRRAVIFTTAETSVSTDMRSAGDFFPYMTERTDANGTLLTDGIALIIRNYDGDSMIEAGGASLGMTNITLDGALDITRTVIGTAQNIRGDGVLTGTPVLGDRVLRNATATADGGIVFVRSRGAVTVADGATLQNAGTNANGGAVYVQSGGALTVTNRTLPQNTAAEKGGAILQNCAAVNGGAVYAENRASVTVTGGTINGNRSTGNGAGIYLAEGGRLYLSGNPYFGGTGVENNALVTAYTTGEKAGKTAGNFSLNALADDAKNGGKEYPKVGTNYMVRQDIYIAGYAGKDNDESANSLFVTGNLIAYDANGNAVPMAPGSIWVWAAESPHYKTLQQFAKYDNAGVTDPETTLKAFRNARVDADTGADSVGQYLYGVTKADDTAHNVFWYGVEGSRRVILRKVSGPADGTTASSLAGASFTVYRQGEKAPYVVKEIKVDGVVHKLPEADCISLSGLTSGANGVFWIGELPYGKYYIVENGTYYYFELIVGDKKDDGTPLPDGYYIGERKEGNPLA